VKQVSENANLNVARRRVAAIKGVYIHLAVYVFVMGILLAIDATIGPGWWVQWPLLGWGAGLLAHAFVIFGQSPRELANWESRKVEAVKRRLDKRASASMKGPTE
jgi:hypothetical protein